jgi:hypothetical protein
MLGCVSKLVDTSKYYLCSKKPDLERPESWLLAGSSTVIADH